MQRETMIESAIKKVAAQKGYKSVIAVSAGCDARQVDRLIEQRDETVINTVLWMAGMGGRMRLVDTEVKRFIEKIIRAAAWAKRFYIVWGPPGCGKTSTARQVIDELREKMQVPISYTRVNVFSRKNLRALQRRISNGFGIVKLEKEGEGSKDGFMAIEKLQDYFQNQQGVVVIDEADRLDEKAFDLVRDLFDDTQLSIVMLGATEFLDRADKQFKRRSDDKYVLPDVTPRDVRVYLKEYGIEIDAREARQISKRIATWGSIDTLSKAMRVIAGDVDEGEMTWKSVDQRF